MACHNSCAGGPHDGPKWKADLDRHHVALEDYCPRQDRAPRLSRTDQWVNYRMVSLPATERLQELLDPILGRRLVRLVRLMRLECGCCFGIRYSKLYE